MKSSFTYVRTLYSRLEVFLRDALIKGARAQFRGN